MKVESPRMKSLEFLILWRFLVSDTSLWKTTALNDRLVFIPREGGAQLEEVWKQGKCLFQRFCFLDHQISDPHRFPSGNIKAVEDTYFWENLVIYCTTYLLSFTAWKKGFRLCKTKRCGILEWEMAFMGQCRWLCKFPRDWKKKISFSS